MPDTCGIYRALITSFQNGGNTNPGDAQIIETGTLQVFEEAAISDPDCVQAFYDSDYTQSCEQMYPGFEIQNSETVAIGSFPNPVNLTVYRRCYIVVPDSGGTINVGHEYIATFTVTPAPPEDDGCVCDCMCECESTT